MFQQHAAMSMNDRFWQAACTGREQHPQGMTAIDLLETKIFARRGSRLQQFVPKDIFIFALRNITRTDQWKVHNMFDRRQCIDDLTNFRITAVNFSTERISIRGKNQFGG